MIFFLCWPKGKCILWNYLWNLIAKGGNMRLMAIPHCCVEHCCDAHLSQYRYYFIVLSKFFVFVRIVDEFRWYWCSVALVFCTIISNNEWIVNSQFHFFKMAAGKVFVNNWSVIVAESSFAMPWWSAKVVFSTTTRKSLSKKVVFLFLRKN